MLLAVTVRVFTHTVSVPAHTHTVTVPDHTHAITMVYGLYEDNVGADGSYYPKVISMWIDGIDRSVALGGPWAAASNTPVDVEFEITSYLVEAAGGLRQNHTVEFRCASWQWDIEVECDLLLTIQAIAVV